MSAHVAQRPGLMPVASVLETADGLVNFRLGQGYKFHEYIILTGWCNRKFSASLKKSQVAIFFDPENRNKEEGTRFVLIYEYAEIPYSEICLDWASHKYSITIPHKKLGKFTGFQGYEFNFAYMGILDHIKRFSPGWHEFLKNCSAEATELLKGRTASPFWNTVWETRKAHVEQGFKIEIERIENNILTGRLSGPDKRSVPVSLFLDNEAILEGTPITEDGFSFRCGLSPEDPDKWSLLTLKEAKTGRLLDFRFLEKPQFDSRYIIRLEYTEPDLMGWTVDGNNPERVYEIGIMIDGFLYARTRNDKPRADLLKKGLSGGKGGFIFSNPVPLMPKGKHEIRFIFPDGALSEKYENISNNSRIKLIRNLQELKRRISIIIPIYNAAEDLSECLILLSKYTRKPYRLILVDDNSPDPKIGEILDKAQNELGAIVIHNEENIGFSGSVNRGIQAAEEDDVILLNSDARVTSEWLEGLLVAAGSSAKIGTVTPMSNRAGAFSAPEPGNDNLLPQGATESDYARAFRRESYGLYPVVPTGNGFCMYIARKCLDETGLFDQEAFPRGYGEENDFCMRAMRKGWRHIIDDRTYVYHERGRSFGTEKQELMQQGAEIINERYPEYRQAIKIFHDGQKINLARHAAIKASMNIVKDRLLRILYVIESENNNLASEIRKMTHNYIDYYLLILKSYELKLYNVVNRKLLLREKYIFNKLPGEERDKEIGVVLITIIYKYDIEELHSEDQKIKLKYRKYINKYIFK